MAASKMSRGGPQMVSQVEDDGDFFDFGEPEVISVEVCPGKFLTLKEPSANDLIEIAKVSDNQDISEVEVTIQTICILHVPDEGRRRLSLKDAKRLSARQLKKLNAAISELLGMDPDSDTTEE